MEKIGDLLRRKRLEMGLTIEDISEKTRLTIKHIKAIEEGDISYFKDDLSYLRFFLKSYCDAVELDFEELKPELQVSIDDYTTSFSKETLIQHQAIERGVKENAEKLRSTSTENTNPKTTKTEKKKKPKKARRRKRVDMSLVSFVAIVFVVLIGLILAFVMYIQGTRNPDEDANTTKPPVAEVPTYTQDPTPPPVVEKEKKEMVITKQSDTQYVLENLEDQANIDIEVEMGSHSSFRVLVNDKQLSKPAQGTYQYKTVLNFTEKAEKDKKIVLAFGFMLKNTIKVNGQQIELPPAVANKEGSAIIELLVKGE